jgi:hypothetical protein
MRPRSLVDVPDFQTELIWSHCDLAACRHGEVLANQLPDLDG